MAPPSMWLAACSVMMLYVAVPHASCHPTPDDASHHEVMPYSQQHDPQPYYYDEEEEYGKEKTNLQDYEPVLAESGSNDRSARSLKRYSIPRGSRFRKGNPKLIKRMQDQLDYQTGLQKRLVIIKDDVDPPLELPEPSSLPWIQLATLGTFAWGLNVIYTQMILDVTDAPNVPLPFGLNRSVRKMVDDSTEEPTTFIPVSADQGASEGLDFTEAPDILLKDVSKASDLTGNNKELLEDVSETSIPAVSVLKRNVRNVLEQIHSWDGSLDFFEGYHSLQIPTDENCREQMICEMRHLMTYVTPLENIIRTYGMRVPGLPQGYQKALDAGSSRRPCKTTAQKEQCPNSLVTILLKIARAITGGHY